MWSQDTVLAYLQANRKRSSMNQVRLLAQTFWELPSMRKWTFSSASDIFIMKGAHKDRQALRFFCADVVEQLRATDISVVFALAASQEAAAAHSMRIFEMLKYLVQQLLSLCRASQTEKFLSVSAAAFSESLTDKEWFQLVEHLLLQLSGCMYLVVDLALLKSGVEKSHDFNLLSAFQGLMKSLEGHQPLTVVKVLLIAYESTIPLCGTQPASSGSVQPARASVTRARKLEGRGSRTRGAGSQKRKARFFKDCVT